MSHQRFADDIVLVASSARVLYQMLLDLNEHSKTAGLTMNFRKTKIMTNRPFIIGKTEIQLVDEYIYLGQLVTTRCPKKSKEECPKDEKPLGTQIYPPGEVLKQEN